MTRALTLTAASILLASGPAIAQDDVAPPPETADATLDVDADLSLGRPAFGTPGSQYFGIVGATGFAFERRDDSTDYNLGLAYHRFLIEDVEFIGELGGWYFDQVGNNAWGVNPGFMLRWHFLDRESWTLYADAGMGLLFSNDEVPDGGTHINFMPRVGAGATVRISERGDRLVVGTRWHHVSNARFNGDDDNPDRDGIAIYAGLMFPF